ncbi:uncharacterized protein K441DRAFT_90935 [Cenococcum geophilum 1.58]|uniref:uncharacterized protein n=1 Tax=Cenococcum geophilum 1.58 TaxID=794803 RepID=UPI00358EE64D|nr:hypothetical protein K441DRAFT_90935 [Cenococcum geophilum 1.58]
MAGVEILGIVASAVQFVDVGLRALLALTKLYSNLQNAPRKLKAAVCGLQQSIRLVQIIQTDIERPYDGPGSTLSVSIAPDMLLRPSHSSTNVDEAKQLESLLYQLTSTPSDHILKWGWRRVIILKDESDILETRKRLERLKSALDLWLGNESLEMVQKQL